MNIYQVEISRDAAKFLKKLDKKTLYRVQGVIELLSQNPRPPKSKKLTNNNYWRVRVGDYRIIYEIHDKNLIIIVIKIANRRDAYAFHGK